MRALRSLIDGQAALSVTASRPIRSPYDSSIVAEFHVARPEDVATAIEHASTARSAMRSMPHHERARILDEVARRVAAARDALASLLVEEAGKPITLARLEVDRCGQTFAEAARCARSMEEIALPLDAAPPGTHRYGIVRRFPVGVIAAITPFNFPLNLVAHKLAPAIAAGCPVVLKPASQTPSVALELARFVHQAGLPAGALHVVLLPGSEAEKLLSDDRLAMVTFTGSAEIGWRLKAELPRKRVTLELGGNAAAIVEPDSDWAGAAERLASGAFGYAGQSCISVQRIFVHEAIAGLFTEAFCAAAERMPTGDPNDEATLCGPLIDRANADRVEQWIAHAASRGGSVLCGNRREGNLIWPTVVENAPDDSELNCSEVFGPVATITRYRRFEDALAAANNSLYGLQAGIYTNDWRRIWQAFDTLEVGGVIHNDAPTYRVDAMPYGGIKMSGSGREGPRWAIEEMTEPRLLVLNNSPR